MPVQHVTLVAGETYVIGAVDLKFPAELIDVVGGTIGTIPNPSPGPRQSDFLYTFTAGAAGYGQYVGRISYFNEYDLTTVTITDAAGAVPYPQSAPVALGESLRYAAGDVIVPLGALTANDSDANGDSLFLQIVSPVRYQGAAGADGYAAIIPAGGGASDAALGAFVEGSQLNVGVLGLDPASAYGTISFDYRLSDGYGNLSAPVTATIQLGTAPGQPTQRGQYIAGTTGDDVIDKSGSRDAWQINGGAGNDVLRGGIGNDSLNGSIGDDRITGGAGNDLITGGAGADRVAGGAGSDTFIFRPGDLATGTTKDQIIDFEGAGAAGGDQLRFEGFGAGATLTLLSDNGVVQKYYLSDGANSGELWVQTVDHKALTAGDYHFYL